VLFELDTTSVCGPLNADGIVQVALVVTTICRVIVEAPDITGEACVILQASNRGYKTAIQPVSHFLVILQTHPPSKNQLVCK
jgi:hypothetical protein